MRILLKRCSSKKVNQFGMQSKTTNYSFLATNQNHQQIKHLQLSHFLKRRTKYFSTSLSTHRFDKEIQVIFSCEPFAYPPTLYVDGNIRFGTKSEILTPLLEAQSSPAHIQPTGMQAVIFDVPAIVQGMKYSDTILSFYQFKRFFWKNIVQHSVNIATIHVVFDVYLKNSLK